MNTHTKYAPIYEKFKDHKADAKLTNISEMYLPFWTCKRNIIVEKSLDIDRFSKILLELIQNGITRHNEISSFLGVEEDSFVYINMSAIYIIEEKKKALKKVLILSDQKQNKTQFNAKFIKLIHLFRQ